MIRKIFFLTLIFYILKGYGQVNNYDLVGKWIKFKTEMKDGSKSLSGFNKDSTYSDITINLNSLVINSNSILKRNDKSIGYSVSGFTGKNSTLDIKYTLEGTLLRTSASSGYSVEKIANDTLIICEKIDGLEDDKLIRNYFISEKKVLEREYEKVKDKKNIIANTFFTPKLNETLENEIFKAIYNRDLNIDLSGALTIFPKKKEITTEINYSSKNKPSKIDLITNIINNSFEKWDLTGFNEFDSIKIPFILRCESNDKLRGVKIIYFTNFISDFNVKQDRIILSLSNEYQELFQKGFEAFNKKKFLKAAECFSKAYKINPRNLDALYNVATSYFEYGDKENACKIWKQLSDLGQIRGIQFYKDICN